MNRKTSIALKKPCTFTGNIMYKHNLKQLEFENFNLPFDGHLRSDNRWVKLAKFIPWDLLSTPVLTEFYEFFALSWVHEHLGVDTHRL